MGYIVDEKVRELVRGMYRDREGRAMVLTDGQMEIFERVFRRDVRRCHVMTFTQYGKSLTVALGVLTRVSSFAEKWIIVAGREKQAKIIMGYIIDHVFDNEYTKGKLEIGGEDMERLRRERSKNRLTFKNSDGIGEVMVLSADSRNREAAGDALMGFGASAIVLDEAALIDDDIEAKVFRMLGGYADNFYLKIGNPFRRNHFYKDWCNEDWYHINIDYMQGIKEGRISAENIGEAKEKPLFDVLYENKFPAADTIDEGGYVPIIAEKDVNWANEVGMQEYVKLGVDPAGDGQDLCTWVVRDALSAKIVGSEKVSTPATIAQKTLTIMREYKVPNNQVYIDSFGIGAASMQELSRAGIIVRDVNVGTKCKNEDDDVKFYNERARVFWNLRDWIRRGGVLEKDSRWNELFNIKYRAELNRKVKIMGKDEMRRKGVRSPNFADALALTFYEPDLFGTVQEITETHFDKWDL